MLSFTPSADSSESVFSARSRCSISVLSVISSVSSFGGTPWRRSTSLTCGTSVGRDTSCADALTCITSSPSQGMSRRHAASWRTASSMAQVVSASMQPVSSANAMNTLGGMMPRCGCVQRASASKPTRRCGCSAYSGW